MLYIELMGEKYARYGQARSLLEAGSGSGRDCPDVKIGETNVQLGPQQSALEISIAHVPAFNLFDRSTLDFSSDTLIHR
jgi:hypothetical protein